MPLKKVYTDKGYFGDPNRNFLKPNHLEDGIMGKGTTTAKLTEYEKQRNKAISKKLYIACPVEQVWFALCHELLSILPHAILRVKKAQADSTG